MDLFIYDVGFNCFLFSILRKSFSLLFSWQNHFHVYTVVSSQLNLHVSGHLYLHYCCLLQLSWNSKRSSTVIRWQSYELHWAQMSLKLTQLEHKLDMASTDTSLLQVSLIILLQSFAKGIRPVVWTHETFLSKIKKKQTIPTESWMINLAVKIVF